MSETVDARYQHFEGATTSSTRDALLAATSSLGELGFSRSGSGSPNYGPVGVYRKKDGSGFLNIPTIEGMGSSQSAYRNLIGAGSASDVSSLQGSVGTLQGDLSDLSDLVSAINPIVNLLRNDSVRLTATSGDHEWAVSAVRASENNPYIRTFYIDVVDQPCTLGLPSDMLPNEEITVIVPSSVGGSLEVSGYMQTIMFLEPRVSILLPQYKTETTLIGVRIKSIPNESDQGLTVVGTTFIHTPSP